MALERLDSVRSSLSSKVTSSSTPEELHPGVTLRGDGWDLFFHGEKGVVFPWGKWWNGCDFCWENKKLKKCMKVSADWWDGILHGNFDSSPENGLFASEAEVLFV